MGPTASAASSSAPGSQKSWVNGTHAWQSWSFIATFEERHIRPRDIGCDVPYRGAEGLGLSVSIRCVSPAGAGG